MAPRKPLAPSTVDRLERMAQTQTRSIGPVLPPSKPKEEVIDIWGPGAGAAGNVPGNQNFVGPTLDPEVIAARSKLGSAGIRATQVGVPPEIVDPIVSGQGDPNRGFLGPIRAVGGFLGKANIDIIPGSKEFKPLGAIGRVGLIGLQAATPALDKFDYGRRFTISLFKEVGDELSVWREATIGGGRERGVDRPWDRRGGGGFSPRDFVNQFRDPSTGFGTTIAKDLTGNPYADQLIGFAGDVLFDPLSWVAGPAGIAKTAGNRALLNAATDPRLLQRFQTAESARVAAMAKKALYEEALDDALRLGDDVAAEAAEKAIVTVDKELASANKILSGDAAIRGIGRTSNQALAESVLGVKDDAQRFLDQAEAIGVTTKGDTVTSVTKLLDDEIALIDQAGGVPLPGSLSAKILDAGLDLDNFAANWANAKRTVDVLGPATIKNIQTSGLAGVAGSYWDILRGRSTAAQEVLGVRGGLRIYNPLEMAGVGTRRVIVPGTERILNATGKLLADSRLGVGRTALGVSVLNRVVPTGEGGLLGSEDLLRLRTGVRSGKLTGVQAEEATRLLALDGRYRAMVQNERKVAGGKITQSNLGRFDKETMNSVLPYLQTDPSQWSKFGLAPLSQAQQEAYDQVNKLLNDYFAYASRASGDTGFIPQRRSNYFPQMQSEKALRWARANPKKAEELAKQLNVDRTWFVGNFRERSLKVGDIFFGYKLKKSDLDQGVTRLNEIAREKGKLNFDFFETDVMTAITAYANKHAQFSALQKAIGAMPETTPALAVRMPGGVNPMTVKGAGRPLFIEIGEDAFADLLDPEAMLAATPQQLKSSLAQVRRIVEQMDRPTVVKTRLVDDIEVLNQQLDDIITQANAAPAGFAQVATDEVKQLARNLYDEAKGAQLNLKGIAPSKFVDYADIVDKGFLQLNYTTAPDISARPEIAQLFQNAARMGDVEFAGRVKSLIQDYTRFSKTYLTMRPGFHARNAISNVFQFVAAGGNPVNAIQGNRILRRVNDGLRKGESIESIARKIVDEGVLIKVGNNPRARAETVTNLIESINFSGSTGFGQFGEIAEAAGQGARGFLVTGEPANLASDLIGRVATKSRKIGTGIENYSRFGLMWDGILQGLTPQQAAARVNKYLLDYQDYSRLDRVGRMVFPFWTFMTKNAPLQLEMMWTNPKAYAWYQSFKRQLEDTRSEEEGGPVIPSYLRDRGVFATKQEGFGRFADAISPNLPFEGGGEEVLSTLIEDPQQLLGSINPLFRAPVESFITGRKFFSRGYVVPKEQRDLPFPAQMQYLIRELLSPASPLRSIVAFVPAEARPQLLNDLLGIRPDDDQGNIQELQALLNWTGVPLMNIRTEQQVRELESRAYKLAEKIAAQRARNEKQQQRQRESVPTTPGEVIDIWGP